MVDTIVVSAIIIHGTALMFLTWSGPEGSSHTSLCLRVPFFYYMNEEDYMRLALKEAEKAAKEDEVPVGAVIVKDGEVIAKAHNKKVHHNLATDHAELIVIQKAEKKLNNWCLDDCDLYVTLEPCMMCTGVIQQARIRRLYYGTSDPKGGCINSLIVVKQIPRLNIYPKEIHTGLLQNECSQILKDFFSEKRKQKQNKR